MKKYHLVNNIIGWVIGIVACTVYILTAEATALRKLRHPSRSKKLKDFLDV